LWRIKNRNLNAQDASAIKRGKAKLAHDQEEHKIRVTQDQNDYKFLRDELIKISDRDREEREELKAEQTRVSKELMVCVTEREFLKARVAHIEDQLLKFTEWKSLLTIARAADSPASLGETKKE
jgi:hypothetical protein